MGHRTDGWMPTRWSLIGRLKNFDDQESWREFFDLYGKLIYAVGLKSGLNPSEAQDVVQDTIISVCQNIQKFRADHAYGSFKAWLLKLTRWRILDQVKKRPREVTARLHKTAKVNESSLSTSTAAQIPDPAANELERIWDNEWERNLLTAALEKLERQVSAKHYQIFFLHVIKQYDVEKVARAADIKPDQVYLIKHRLQPLFRAAIDELETRMK